MRSREAMRKARKNYANKLKCITLKLNRRLDEGIINHLDGKENMTAYIRDLIKADMAKGGE